MNIDLMNGDCLELMKIIPDKSVDVIITDPPYATTACKWDTIIPFEPMWIQLKRIIKLNGAIILFGSEPFSSHLRMSNLKMYKYDWVWDKPHGTGFLNAKIQPIRSHEIISVFYSKQPIYNPIKTQGHTRKTSIKRKDTAEIYGTQVGVHKYDSTERYPRTIQRFSSDKQLEALHPTQKPVELLEYLIKTYSNENETVLDFTMGSGSTGIACLNTNRNFIGIELDDNYFKIASDRINKRQNEIDTQLVF